MEPKKKKSSIGSWLAGLGILLITFGSKLKALLPLLKVGKFLPTLLTMILSIWTYTLIAPFQVAFGLVMMIFIHEMGHVLAAKQKGLPASAPAFIPFVGALIMLKKQPQDAATEAFVAIGGPLLGTMGALGCWMLGFWTGEAYYYVIAYIGFFLNLFNLIPIHPLDGGRIVVAVSRWFWVLGLVLGLVVIFYLKSIILSIIYILFVYNLYLRYIKKKKPSASKHMGHQALKISVKLDPYRFEEVGAYIPSELHERDLEYQYYTDLTNKQTYLDLFYPSLGRIVTLPDFQGEVKKVRLVRTQMTGAGKINLYILVEYSGLVPQESEDPTYNEKYYEVRPKHRLIYGFSYLGLAALLVYMMWLTQPILNQGNGIM